MFGCLITLITLTSRTNSRRMSALSSTSCPVTSTVLQSFTATRAPSISPLKMGPAIPSPICSLRTTRCTWPLSIALVMSTCELPIGSTGSGGVDDADDERALALKVRFASCSVFSQSIITWEARTFVRLCEAPTCLWRLSMMAFCTPSSLFMRSVMTRNHCSAVSSFMDSSAASLEVLIRSESIATSCGGMQAAWNVLAISRGAMRRKLLARACCAPLIFTISA
mmetsp:Transcript_33802/g.80223  ORF Transcript_33802/g.80223 Transcript_33802/m.80223 type:complete len:224 (+) Transcript_33802:83-754(+)